jgi:hypothetical protein
MVEAKELHQYDESSKESSDVKENQELKPKPVQFVENPRWVDSAAHEANLKPLKMESQDLLSEIREGYRHDTIYNKIIDNVSHHASFTEQDGILYCKNRAGERVMCIPRVVMNKRRITEMVIDQAHTTLGHFGTQKTGEYIRKYFWWPTLGKDVEAFCKTCVQCTVTKPRTTLNMGLLHSMPIPSQPWESISMDFIGPFPKSRDGHDYLWVIMCRLTSLVHLVPVTVTITATELAWKYIYNIVRLHGVPMSIVSDHDAKFTSAFWRESHRLMGTKLLMSTAFHPQTDGATERQMRSIGQIMRTMVNPDQRNWVECVPLTEYAINSSINASTGFAPFELTYGYIPRIFTGIQPKREDPPGVRSFAQNALRSMAIAHDAIIASRVIQTHQANKTRKADADLPVGALVFVSTENLALPKGRARKLMPKYIGPYPIIKSHPESSSYTVNLPDELASKALHATFHVSKLRPHEPNDEVLFPNRDTKFFYDFGAPHEDEWLVDAITSHRWNGRKVDFEVKWNLGEKTWESYEVCRNLAALDEYLALQNVREWKRLPRHSQ